MTTPRSHCWIAGYTERLETGAASPPEEDCAALEPGEWEAGQRAAAENVGASRAMVKTAQDFMLKVPIL